MKQKVFREIGESYDRVAKEYAQHLFKELDNKPLDRQLLKQFADEVRGRGEVCDTGCGPGHVAGYLHDLGIEVFGIDLSPGMVEQAAQLNRNIQFRVGDMMALDIPNEALAGIVAFYAIVNIPAEFHARLFAELARALQADGLLLLAFHVGDEIIHPEELWGQRIAMDFFYFELPAIRHQLESAGFRIEDVVEREPYAPEVEHQSRRAYIFAC